MIGMDVEKLFKDLLRKSNVVGVSEIKEAGVSKGAGD